MVFRAGQVEKSVKKLLSCCGQLLSSWFQLRIFEKLKCDVFYFSHRLLLLVESQYVAGGVHSIQEQTIYKIG